MKIAIASSSDKEEALVSPITGRAEFYLIFEDDKLIEAIKNPFVVGGGGAGVSVAQMLANKEVNVVIGGKFGPNMTSILDEKKIKYIMVQDITVKDAVKTFLEDEK